MNLTRHIWQLSALLCLFLPGVAHAQRELYWDRLDVEAHLRADGTLRVTESHAMVFTGDWNGGERQFNIRPRQRIGLIGIERLEPTGTSRPLTEDARLNSVDDYAWFSRTTLRWRSRLPSDASFDATTIRYVIRYELFGILEADGPGRYRLNHDFAFPDRVGSINRFSLRLTFDEGWQPAEQRPVYTAGPLEPGRSFVLSMPLTLDAAATPEVLDTSRPLEVVAAVAALLLLPVAAAALFFRSETALGRFAPVTTGPVDGTWVAREVLVHPAEVVGAAWDEDIGSAEVVALIARMVAEGRLESSVKGKDMSLRLTVDRHTLTGRERELVDGLFFGGRTETSTDAVKKHYKNTGFDPTALIKPDLRAAVDEVVPAESGDHAFRLGSQALFWVAAGLLAIDAYLGDGLTFLPFGLAIAAIVLAALGQIPGWLFRMRIDWEQRAALLCLLPAALATAGVSWYVWFRIGTGEVAMSPTMLGAVVVLTLWIALTSIGGLRSRQSAERIAFRRRLAAARGFFAAELEKPQPALRNDWWPWVLAFGLGKQADDWSARYDSASRGSSGRTRSTDWSSSSSSGSSGSGGADWIGGGGRSGGGGGGASWAAAAGGMAASVSPPSSSGSGGGGSSSSGGSSGGGGGGGW